MLSKFFNTTGEKFVCKLFANKKDPRSESICNLLKPIVPGTGIEPALPCENQILS